MNAPTPTQALDQLAAIAAEAMLNRNQHMYVDTCVLVLRAAIAEKPSEPIPRSE